MHFCAFRECIVIRCILQYLFGSLLGAFFWSLVLRKIGLPFDIEFILGLSVTLFLGYGCAFSVQIRCFSSLCLVGFLGRAGRSMLKAIVLSCILTGPIRNLGLNAREVVRVFTCSTVLTYNLSMVQFNLITKPFQNALLGSKEKLGIMKEEFRAMVYIVEPIKLEVEGGNETYRQGRRERRAESVSYAEFYRENYKQKLEARCKEQLARGIRRCESGFAEVYDKCRRKLPFLADSMLCWPMKISYICGAAGRLFGDADRLCSSDDVIDPDFGEHYEQMKRAKQLLIGDLEGIEIEYEFVDVEQHSGYLTAKQTSKEVVRKFEEKKSSVDLVAFVLERLFAFVFIRVILNAASYHQNYLRKMDFRNHYITDYFLHIDQRRKRSKKVHLLPLRRIERPHLVDLNSRSCSPLESSNVIGHSMSLILQLITVTVFILVDYFFCETLEIVARHSKALYEQEGYHDVNVTVTGSGIIASMVRRTVERFDTHERIHFLTSNKQCLPKPTKLETWDVVCIYLLLLGILILMLNEPYIERMRRFVCAWFYPKREKQRILFLYNRLMKRRKGLVKQLMERLQQTIRKRRYSTRMHLMDRLLFYYPRCCCWIKLFRKKSCSVCGVKGPERFNDCSNFRCFLTYCDECWQDLNETCAACNEPDHLDHDCALHY